MIVLWDELLISIGVYKMVWCWYFVFSISSKIFLKQVKLIFLGCWVFQNSDPTSTTILATLLLSSHRKQASVDKLGKQQTTSHQSFFQKCWRCATKVRGRFSGLSHLTGCIQSTEQLKLVPRSTHWPHILKFILLFIWNYYLTCKRLYGSKGELDQKGASSYWKWNQMWLLKK
jgi:hypothetical protein